MVERDLTIKAKVEGGAAAKAEVDGLTSSVDKLKATETPLAQQQDAQVQAFKANAAAMKDAASGAQDLGTASAAASTRVADLTARAIAAQQGLGGMARVLQALGGVAGAVLLPLVLLPMAIEPVIKGITFLNDKAKEGAAALANWTMGLKESDIAVRKAGESLEQYATRLKAVSDRADDIARAQLAMGAGLIAEQGDLDKARIAWQAHEAAMHGNAEQYPLLIKAAQDMGFKFAESHDRMAEKAQTFANLYAAELKKSQAAATAFAELNNGAIQKIIDEYAVAGVAVPADLKKIADGLGLVADAQKKLAEDKALHEKFLDDVNVTKVLEAELERLTGVFGSQKAAFDAMAPSIQHMTDELTKLKGLNASDEATRQAMLASLTALAAKYGLVTGEMKKVTDAADKAVVVFKEQQARIADLSREYDRHAAAIAASADKSTAALNREADSVRTALGNEIKDLRKSQLDWAGDSAGFNERMNTLSAALNLAMNEAQAERDRIRDKEREDLDKLAERHEKAAGRIEAAQKRISEAAKNAAEGVQHSSEQISTDIDAMKEKVAESLRGVEEKTVNAGQSFKDMATKAAEGGRDVVPIIKDLAQFSETAAEKLERAAAGGNLAAAMLLALHQSGAALPGLLNDIGAAADSAFDAGAGGTPGSEGF